jgi:hypothetical protein
MRSSLAAATIQPSDPGAGGDANRPACYVLDAMTRFLVPSMANTSAAVFVLPEIICEVSLLAYLLVVGVKTSQPATS